MQYNTMQYDTIRYDTIRYNQCSGSSSSSTICRAGLKSNRELQRQQQQQQQQQQCMEPAPSPSCNPPHRTQTSDLHPELTVFSSAPTPLPSRSFCTKVDVSSSACLQCRVYTGPNTPSLFTFSSFLPFLVSEPLLHHSSTNTRHLNSNSHHTCLSRPSHFVSYVILITLFQKLRPTTHVRTELTALTLPTHTRVS